MGSFCATIGDEKAIITRYSELGLMNWFTIVKTRIRSLQLNSHLRFEEIHKNWGPKNAKTELRGIHAFHRSSRFKKFAPVLGKSTSLNWKVIYRLGKVSKNEYTYDPPSQCVNAETSQRRDTTRRISAGV